VRAGEREHMLSISIDWVEKLNISSTQEILTEMSSNKKAFGEGLSLIVDAVRLVLACGHVALAS